MVAARFRGTQQVQQAPVEIDFDAPIRTMNSTYITEDGWYDFELVEATDIQQGKYGPQVKLVWEAMDGEVQGARVQGWLDLAFAPKAKRHGLYHLEAIVIQGDPLELEQTPTMREVLEDIQHMRVKGLVQMSEPRQGRNGPVQYANIVEFAPYDGPFKPGSPQQEVQDLKSVGGAPDDETKMDDVPF